MVALTHNVYQIRTYRDIEMTAWVSAVPDDGSVVNVIGITSATSKLRRVVANYHTSSHAHCIIYEICESAEHQSRVPIILVPHELLLIEDQDAFEQAVTTYTELCTSSD